MSDVVNSRKQIAKDGRRATIHDWLGEKEGEIDLETFECLNFLKILSQLDFEIGHSDTAGVCVCVCVCVEMKYEWAQKRIHFPCFPLIF